MTSRSITEKNAHTYPPTSLILRNHRIDQDIWCQS